MKIYRHHNQASLTVLFFCASLMFSGLAAGATSATCLSNSDEVVIRGMAQAERLKVNDGREITVWILTTENPICINEFADADSLKKAPASVSRIQITGVAPPAGVLIDFKGILRTGNAASYYAVPNSIAVSSAAKVRKSGGEVVAAAGPVKNARSHETEVKAQPVPKAVTDALQAAKPMALLFKVDSLEIELDDTPGAGGYSIYLHYNKDVFTDRWAGQEAIIAFDNDYNLAREFVKQLINTGQDPAVKTNPKYVDVCSEIDGVNALSKMPEFELIGCARYTPAKDVIDPDFTRISDRLVAPK